MSQLSNALLAASLHHEGQLDKGGKPYIFHPMAVAVIVNREGGTEDQTVAAMLHDTVEDTNMTLAGLKSWGFSEKVIELVEVLTHRKPLGETYQEYIDRIKLNKDAILIKLADLEHNSDATRKGYSESLAKRYTKAAAELREAYARF
jgi:(p)ppGpp synthase/HD superfamily hydrolase